jgi:peptide/nickel transport system substrate-binding protein
MRRLLFAVLLLGGMIFVPTTVGARADKVTYTVGATQEVDSLNVNVGYLVVDYEVWNNIWPTLTNLAADDFAVVPAMADSWTSSDDGLTWTFKMHPDMKWSDGEPMGAEDVKYTLDRANEEEWFNYTSTTKNLTAEIPDPDTLVIKTTVADPRLPAVNFYVLPKHIYEKLDADAAANHPAEDRIGGGPFMIDEVKAGEFVRLARNPNWFGKQPAMDELIIRTFADAESEFQALQAGEIDAVDDVPVQLFTQIKEGGDILGVQGNQGGFDELAMNAGCSTDPYTGHVALTDPLVRQAINYAIDRDLMVEKSLNGLGVATDAMSPSASRAWDYNAPDDEKYTYQPEKAKELLDQAGWVDDGSGTRSKDGVELRLRYFDRNTGLGRVNTEFIRDWLQDVGIATELETMDPDTLGERLYQNDFDLFTWNWVPFVDPDPQLYNFTKEAVNFDTEASLSNDANWCDDEYDALYIQQQQELDPAKRHDIVEKMLKIFHDRGPYAVLYRSDDLQAFRTDKWENFVRQPKDTGPVLFTNASPAYLDLRLKDGGGGGDSGTGAGLWIGIGAGVVALTGIGLLVRNRRASGSEDDDDRE